MRRMLNRSKNVLKVATLIWIVAVPVWSQEGSASEELGPDERRALEIVQQVMESGELANREEASDAVLSALAAEFGQGHPVVVGLTHTLAVQFYQEGRYGKARQLFEQLVEVWTEIEGEDHPSTLSALNNLAVVLQDQGDLPKALAIKKQVLAARSRILGEEHPDTLTSKANLAVTLSALGDLAGARAREEEVLAALSRILGEEHPDTLVALHNVAVTYQGMRDFKKALSSYEKIIRSHREAQGEGYLPVTENEAKTLLGLGRVHQVLLVYNVGPDRTQLFVLSRDGELVARPIGLTREILRKQVTRFRELVAPDPDNLKSSDPIARDELGRWLFTKLIPTDAGLESADRWLILADGPLHMLPFGALVRPKEKPGNWHHLAQHKPLHTVQSMATYAELQSRRHDGIQIAEGSSEAASWVGFGDPVYPVQVAELKRDEGKDGRRILRLGEERAIFDGLVELPNTEKEIHGISSLLPEGSTRTYLDAAATEEQALSDLTQARIIHFATHGVALPYWSEIGMDSMDSFLALSLFDESELEKRGLTHNGLLQAWEIVDLQLNADLVVLSACQTAIGEDQAGDGLISLSRAFQIAGARSILASLWTVNDLSTSEFMIRFYEHLLKGKTKDVALQDTQREFIEGSIEIDGKEHDFRHPYYWAAFQLIGDYQ